jgi:hypothetical protein
MRRSFSVFLLMTGLVCGAASSASAQQTFNFTIGGFVPTNGTTCTSAGVCTTNRVDDDVLVANQSGSAALAFNVKDFNSAAIGGEWLVGLGPFLEAGAGVSFSRKTVPTVYANFTDTNGSEIEQSLRLQIVPVAFTLRLLPFGHSSPVQPYIGGGLGLLRWNYRESGDFIDFSGGRRTVFNDTFEANGTATGPIVLGGIRFSGDVLAVGGEFRYQKADGDLNDDFVGSKIDLGGWTYQATVGVRFK